MNKPHIRASSAPLLCRIDEYIRQYNVRGPTLSHAASDVLDGYSTRRELDDLIKRRFLTVDKYEHDSAWIEVGLDLCGHGWSVALTDRAMKALWPTRLAAQKQPPKYAALTHAHYLEAKRRHHEGNTL